VPSPNTGGRFAGPCMMYVDHDRGGFEFRHLFCLVFLCLWRTLLGEYLKVI
jgi:hypothetical protein